MTEGWSPGEGERVYLNQDGLGGCIIACETGDDDLVYLVELDAAPGAVTASQSHRWGYEPAEIRRCTIEELTPGC